MARNVVGAIATACAYYIAAAIGESLAFPSAPVSALWAPNAILMAALALARQRWWPLYLGVVFIAHFLAQLPIVPPSRVAIQFLANCAVGVIGALVLHRQDQRGYAFDRLRPVMTFILVAAIVGPVATSLLLSFAFAALGFTTNPWLTATVRSVTNCFAILTCVPLIMKAAVYSLDTYSIRVSRLIEIVVFVISLGAIGFAVFVLPATGHYESPSLFYALFPILLWGSVRFGTGGVCASMLAVGALTTWGVLHESGPFVGHRPVEDALAVVFFLVVTTIPLLLLASLLSERRDTLAALVDSEARRRDELEVHKSVMASIEDQIAVVDRDGYVLEVNAAWRVHAMRKDAPEFGALPGTSYFDQLRVREADPALANQIRDALQSVLRKESPRRKLEYRVRTAAGTRWMDHSIETLIRAEGGAVLTVTDVTDRKNAELEAQSRFQQLAHLGRVALVGEISGAIAHEVSQPLAAMLGNAQAGARLLSKRRGVPKELSEILEDIIRNGVRATEVIERVRTLLRGGTRRVERLSINQVVSDALELLHADLERRSVRVTMDLTPDLGEIEGDRVQLQQVVVNLIVNSCEAMDVKPTDERQLWIRTRAGERAEEIELTVQDSGPGILNDDHERIFRAFASSKREGLGLGLAISRSIAQAHGGRLWAEHVARGALFRMTLRRYEAVRPARPALTLGEEANTHVRH